MGVETKPPSTPVRSPASQKSATNSTSTSVKKKKKSAMVKIRGFLSGKSRKERRQERTPSKSSPSKSKMAGDTGSKLSMAEDQSTVYNVNLDGASTNLASPGSASMAAKQSLLDSPLRGSGKQKDGDYLLKVVLLLLDAQTRRFELLQLEFDTEQATAADLLAQVPHSVTETVIQAQPYDGLTTCRATTHKGEDRLADFCSGHDILVAIPQGLSAAACIKLALPILSDAKVVTMLKDSGIDTSSWKDTKEIAKNELKKEAMLKATSKPESSQTDSKITFHPNQEETSSQQGGAVRARGVSAPGKSGIDSGGSWFSKLFVLLGVLVLIKSVDTYLSTPISVGRVLSPGTVLHKCGVVGAVPGLQKALTYVFPKVGECENASLVVEDDKVTGYDADGNVSWIVSGTYHKKAKHCDVQGEADCKLGLHFLDDQRLVLSGAKITWVEVYEKGLKLTPWPFAEKPQTRIWKK